MLRRVWAVLVVVVASLAAPTHAGAHPGDLDPGFGTVTLDGGYQASDVALTADGSTIVLAQRFDVGIELVRLTADGDVDETFGDGGRAIIAEGRYLAEHLAVAPDGRIAVSYGSYPEPRTQGWSTMVLLDADGHETAHTDSFAGAFDAMTFAGSDVIGGAAYGTFGYQGFSLAVVRVSPTGAVTRLLDVPGGVRSAVVDGHGRIVLGLPSSTDPYSDTTYVVRLQADGRPDPSFGFGGIASVPSGTRRAPGETVEGAGGSAGVDAADRVIVAGAPPRRLLADGRPDPSFDAHTLALPTWHVYGVDARGGVLLGDADAGNLVRLTPSGAWDSTFGRCGATADVMKLAVRGARAVAVVPDGTVRSIRLDDTQPASAVHGPGLVTAATTGAVRTFGGACFAGSVTFALNRPVVTVETTPSARGYWLAASDGGIFTFGDAPFLGSTGAMRLNQPIVTMASTPSGRGYWLVASDGGVFTFGDAPFLGSLGALHLNQPIVGMTPTASGRGYWLVASDGGVFTFGDATYFGSGPERGLRSTVVDIARTPTGRGYWMLATDGSILLFGDATNHGGPTLAERVPTALVAVPGGYVVAYDRDRYVDTLSESGRYFSAFRQGWPGTVVDAAYVG